MKFLTLLFLNIIFSLKISADLATFAGGCFWCMEPPFESIEGVSEVVSGYMGGNEKNPSYEEVSSGETGHLEVVQISFDPSLVSFEDLLEIFWRQIDPTDSGGQFVDRGSQYTSAIFYHSEEQLQIAKKSVMVLKKGNIFKKPIVTPITPAKVFYRAEAYHQDFYLRNSMRYKFYRYRSGRDQFLEKIWSNKSGFKIFKTADNEKFIPQNENIKKVPRHYFDSRILVKKDIKNRLTKLQFFVTQENGTEPPFENEYWDNRKKGLYVDIVSGEPLFSSIHKYKSGTGWPSFWRPLTYDSIVELEDLSLWSRRIEVRSSLGDSHLGHVFNDGPEPTGLRYCINSAALEFIPLDSMAIRGYSDFLYMFK